jgi:hypothetical protein
MISLTAPRYNALIASGERRHPHYPRFHFVELLKRALKHIDERIAFSSLL